MRSFAAASLLCVLVLVSLNARDRNPPLRVDLAERQRSLGYSLADVLGSREVYVVSPTDRTSIQARAKNIQKLTSPGCSSNDGRYSLSHASELWLHDSVSHEAEQIEAEGQYSTQCFSPDGKFVYSTGKTIRIYDPATKKRTDVGKVERPDWPTWSPDGRWVGFDDGKHYVLFDPETKARKKLFSTKDSSGPDWSPDSRYLTYTKPGGSMGGFLFWGIKCIEPYRVWVWRVEDDAHDWVQQICKPGRGFSWVQNSDLTFEQH